MADGTFIREDVQGFLALVNSLPPPEALIPEEQRMGYIALKAMTEADPKPMAVIKDLTCPGPAGDILVRFYDVRSDRDPSPVVLFFHGGGFVIGDLDTHNSLCTELSATLDLPVLAVHYRLAPEHPSPPRPTIAKPPRAGWLPARQSWAARSPAWLRLAAARAVTLLPSPPLPCATSPPPRQCCCKCCYTRQPTNRRMVRWSNLPRGTC